MHFAWWAFAWWALGRGWVGWVGLAPLEGAGAAALLRAELRLVGEAAAVDMAEATAEVERLRDEVVALRDEVFLAARQILEVGEDEGGLTTTTRLKYELG